jgi:hypothetical protein
MTFALLRDPIVKSWLVCWLFHVHLKVYYCQGWEYGSVKEHLPGKLKTCVQTPVLILMPAIKKSENSDF